MFYLEKNYQDMVQLTNLPEDFIKNSPPDIFRQQIIKDLDRSGFIKTRTGNFMDFIFHWLSIHEHTSYTQGDMSGDVFSSMINLSALYLEKFIRQSNVPIDELLGQYMLNKKTILYSFFDDDKVLCGISLAYYANDSSAWTATIIRNTTASPKDRQVVVFCNEFMLDFGDNDSQCHTVDFNTGKKKFFNFLNCKQIRKDLAPCFGKNGLLNLNQLQNFEKKIHVITQEQGSLLNELYDGTEFAETALGQEFFAENMKESFLQRLFRCFTACITPPLFEKMEPTEVMSIENKNFQEIDAIIDSITAPVEGFTEVISIIEQIEEQNADNPEDNISEEPMENKKQLR